MQQSQSSDLVMPLLVGGAVVGGVALLVYLYNQDQKRLDSMDSKDKADVMKARAYSGAAAAILSGTKKQTTKMATKKATTKRKTTTKRKSSAGMKAGQIALAKIRKRAKEMRASNSSLSQTMAIKKASAEYRAGKL